MPHLVTCFRGQCATHVCFARRSYALNLLCNVPVFTYESCLERLAAEHTSCVSQLRFGRAGAMKFCQYLKLVDTGSPAVFKGSYLNYKVLLASFHGWPPSARCVRRGQASTNTSWQPSRILWVTDIL